MKKRILYVDDSDANQAFMKLLFKNKNIDIVVANNGAEGLEMFKSHPFDLIIADLYMPIMNGIQMYKEIRKINKKIPVIGFTGADLDMEDDEVSTLGFTKMIHKPIDDADLIQSIESYLK